MEIIEIQSNHDLRSTKEFTGIFSLSSELFPNVCTLAKQIVAVFGNTHICEHTLSRMKIVKFKTRSRLTDQHYETYFVSVFRI